MSGEQETRRGRWRCEHYKRWYWLIYRPDGTLWGRVYDRDEAERVVAWLEEREGRGS